MSAAVFWTAVASMVLLAVLLIVWPLLRRASAGGEVADDVRRAENVAAYRQQRLELEAAHGAGSLEAGAYAAALLELDRRLLADTATADGGAAGSGNGRALLLAAAIGVPLLALLLYRQFGAYSELELGAMISGLSAPMAAAERREQLARLVPLLEAQVRRRDPEGSYRFLLARIDAAEGREAAAQQAIGEVLALAAATGRAQHRALPPDALLHAYHVLAGAGDARADALLDELAIRLDEQLSSLGGDGAARARLLQAVDEWRETRALLAAREAQARG